MLSRTRHDCGVFIRLWWSRHIRSLAVSSLYTSAIHAVCRPIERRCAVVKCLHSHLYDGGRWSLWHATVSAVLLYTSMICGRFQVGGHDMLCADVL
jgi:hypothetical protein